MTELIIDKKWKFWVWATLELVVAIGILGVLCLVGYQVLFSEKIAYNQMTSLCDKQFGEGNWTIQDTKVRSNWFSIGQEFTCVGNGTEQYLNEVLKK